MAYAATVSVRRLGDGNFELTISETECAATSEKEIVLATHKLPLRGRISMQDAKLTPGTAATINPLLGHVTNPTAAADIVISNTPAALSVNNLPAREVPYEARTGSLFHRAQPNAGTDNTVVTRYKIRAGV